MRYLMILLLVAPLACAFQAGPIHLAVGDTEASSCHTQATVDADGAYICEGGSELARGSGITDNLADIFNGVFDLARSLVAGLGAGLAAVGAPADDGDEG
jgi:hypothetical protein